MRAFRHIRSSGGFTLFETLVAISILGIAIAVVIQLYSANLRALSSSEDYILASMRGEAKMREVLLRSDLSEGSWSESVEDGYRFDITVQEVLGERTQNLQIKMLQVSLSVTWSRGTREKSIRMSTMNVVPRGT
ncbi:MAG: prepilin-type N-terminal cleavage/methylation domain-containing protein [Deltaproteobacteria bacterium]|nr:prepilin-type N-terminal cleavage/methylation domain-containing protein [Deltaproteobacteria bacterium]NIS76318.1 prepilin-type N-terminal cleavage/methylation domain-containing protein [Deltaproteobacteria bacterium]